MITAPPNAIAPDPATALALDTQGYVVLPARLDAVQLATLRLRYDELIAAEGDRAGTEVHQEGGTKRLAHLVDKGICFDAIWNDPRVLGCVAHILKRPFRLSSLNGREPLLGCGFQSLHADWGGRLVDEPYHVVNSLWLVDDLTPDNGATRVVPGSHLLPGAITEHVDPAQPHAREISITAPAGSVVVFNAHTWHGGGMNRSGERRRILYSYYVGEGNSQQYDIPGLLSAATRARLTSEQLTLLGCNGGWWWPTSFPEGSSNLP